jgi:transposase
MKRQAAVNNTTCRVGIDVSKETLQIDAGDLFQGTVPNVQKEIIKQLKTLRGKADIHVCCEATGPYDKPLVRACQSLGLPVSRLNPARVAHYRKSQGVLAKTDKDDARVIRLFAENKPPAPLPPPDTTREKLRQLHLLRDAAVDHRTALSNLRATLDLPELRKTLDADIRALDRRVAMLEAKIQQAVDASDPVFAGLVAALDGITGIALLTATKLAAHTPELGALTRRRAASLAGLAPFPDDSGARSGPRHIRGGRKPIRDALYMAAQTASIHSDVLCAVYQRLKAAGKHHNVALTAVMRKLFLYANLVAAKYYRSLEASAVEPGFVSAPDFFSSSDA